MAMLESMAKKNSRSRNKDGRLRATRSDATVGALREKYGDRFAEGYNRNKTWGKIMDETGATSVNDMRLRC